MWTPPPPSCIFPNRCNHLPYKYYQLCKCKSDRMQWETYPELQILAELKGKCTISNAMQCKLKIICNNMQEFLVEQNWAEKCAMGTSLIYRIIYKQILIKRIRAMCTNLIICKLKMCPSSPSNECTAHSVCPREPRLAINNAYMSCLGQYRLVTQRGKLFGLDALCALCQLCP